MSFPASRLSGIIRRLIRAWLCVVGCSLLAAEPVRSLGQNSTREEVIALYGKPVNRLYTDGKEILVYPFVSVTLERGKIERMDFSADAQGQAMQAKTAPSFAPGHAVSQAPTSAPPPTVTSPTPVKEPDVPAPPAANPLPKLPQPSSSGAVPPPKPAAPTAAPTGDGAARDKPPPNAGATSLSEAYPLVMAAIGGGVLFAGLAWWLLWRKSKKGKALAVDTTSIANRIALAASGVPTLEEVSAWPKQKLRAVYAGLMEADNYEVVARENNGEGDLTLTRKGETRPTAIVVVQEAEAGQVSTRKVKELFGTISLEDIPKGWFVAPGGFSTEARNYASQHPLVLIDAEDIVSQISALPEFTREQVLKRMV